jgi:hypothetical protein
MIVLPILIDLLFTLGVLLYVFIISLVDRVTTGVDESAALRLSADDWVGVKTLIDELTNRLRHQGSKLAPGMVLYAPSKPGNWLHAQIVDSESLATINEVTIKGTDIRLFASLERRLLRTNKSDVFSALLLTNSGNSLSAHTIAVRLGLPVIVAYSFLFNGPFIGKWGSACLNRMNLSWIVLVV